MTDSDEYNDGYTHEALHTAHVLMDTWDQHVADTRCADEFPDVKDAVEKAADAMYAAYQLIGQKFKDDGPVVVVPPRAAGLTPAADVRRSCRERRQRLDLT